jgi:hypothetical protein
MKICLESGEEAEARAIDGNVLNLQSPRAFAPGSPIRFTVDLGDGAKSFEGRAIGSRRVDDRRFDVRMRFVNLRRTDREALAARLASA